MGRNGSNALRLRHVLLIPNKSNIKGIKQHEEAMTPATSAAISEPYVFHFRCCITFPPLNPIVLVPLIKNDGDSLILYHIKNQSGLYTHTKLDLLGQILLLQFQHPPTINYYYYLLDQAGYG